VLLTDIGEVRFATLIGSTHVAVLNEAILLVITADGAHRRYNLPSSDSSRTQTWERSESPAFPIVNPETVNDPRFPDVAYAAAPDQVIALIGVGSYAVLVSSRGWFGLEPYLTRFDLTTNTFETRPVPLAHYLNVLATPSGDLALCSANGSPLRIPWT